MGQNQSVTTANWSSQPAVFHHNHGNNIRLSENNTVAERAASYSGVVMTAEPVPIGKMFQVTVLEKEKNWLGGLVSVTAAACVIRMLESYKMLILSAQIISLHNCAVPRKEVYQSLVEKSCWRNKMANLFKPQFTYFWLPVMSSMQITMFIFMNKLCSISLRQQLYF